MDGRCCGIGKRVFLSDVVDVDEFVRDKLNLIVSPCGTGKTKFVTRTLLSRLGDVEPWEMIIVASRSLIVDQLAEEPGVTKFNPRNRDVVRYWNGEIDDVGVVDKLGIQAMTYDKLINIIINENPSEGETLQRLKVIVLDECHCMFSDVFMTGMGEAKQWIRRTLDYAGKRIIGLTATPDIIYAQGESGGFKINLISDEALKSYVAKQLVCTNSETIPYLITSGTLQGRTLIMSPSVVKCYWLQERIPNSTVMISPNNDGFTDEMGRIRTCIVEQNTIPDYYYVDAAFDEDGVPTKKEKRELKVLIVTSTGREGYNLGEHSGVRNIVSCMTDSLHVTQFAGRARYNLDKLVVADTFIPSDGERLKHLVDERKAFKDFLYSKSCLNWFASIGDLVGHPVGQTWRIVLGSDEVKFVSYINDKWLVPVGADEAERYRRKIWRDADKLEIREKFCECKITKKPLKYVTFAGVITVLEKFLGYEVETGRQSINNKQHTYKLVVSFDEEKIKHGSFSPTINEVSGGETGNEPMYGVGA